MKTVILSTISLFSHSLTARKKALVASSRHYIQRVAGSESKKILRNQKIVTLQKKTDLSVTPLSPASPRSFKRRLLTKNARLDFGQPPATRPHQQRCRSGRGEGSKKETIAIEPAGVKEVWFRIQNPA